MKNMLDSEIIDYYYSSATSQIDARWFEELSYDRWYDYIIGLDDKEKVAYLVSILDEEVYNGGFNQYFIDGYGQFAIETIYVLKQIEAFKMADLLRLAFEAVNSDDLDGITFRRKLLAGEINRLYDDDNLDDYLELLSGKYTCYEENIGFLLGKYLRS